MKEALKKLNRQQLIEVAAAANTNFAAILPKEKIIDDILYMSEAGRSAQISAALAGFKNQAES